MKEVEKWIEEFKQLMSKRFNQLDAVLKRLKSEKK
jgi:hypothetical protein